MAVERVVIEITGDTSKIKSTIAELEKLGKVDRDNADSFNRNNKKFNDNLNSTKSNLGSFGDQLNSLKQQVIGAFAISSLVAFGKEAVQTSAKIESVGNSLKFITGSASGAQKTMEYLRSLSERLGLEFESTAQAFKLFAGAATQSGMSLSQSKTIFEQVSKAVTTMGLSADDAQGVFLALSQIMSKGKVSAEELRGQIGERLPGAFAIAAKSIGVSEQALNKMLEQGQVLSKDFLPKFASQLEKDLGGGAEAAANSTQAALNRMKNSYDEFLLYVGQKLSPAVQSLTKVFQGLTYALRGEAGERERAAREQGAEYAKEIIKDLEKIEGLNARSDAALEKRNFFQKREFQTQQEINKLIAERDELLSRPRKAGTAISGRLNEIEKEIQALAGNKYMYQEITSSLKEYENELSQQNKSLFQNTEETNANTKSKEKQLGEYAELVKAASELEKTMRDTLAADGIISPQAIAQLDDLQFKIKAIEIALKNINDPSLKTAGGIPLGINTPLPEQLPSGDFGAAAQKQQYDELLALHQDFLNDLESQDAYYEKKKQDQLDKELQAQEAFYQMIPQFAAQSISIIAQYQNQAAEYELQVLNEKLAAKQISDKEYEKERRKILTKQAQDQKAAAILQATIDIAGSIMSTLKQFGGTPYGIAMAAITAGLGAAQLAVIQSQKIPKFKKGTDYVSLNGNPKGEDTIPALLNEGEAIIRTEENAKYPGLAKAWNDGKLDEHIYSKWITPELILKKSIEREAIDYDKLGQSVADSIKKNPQVKVSFDKSGFATYIIKGSSVINYQNNRYSSK